MSSGIFYSSRHFTIPFFNFLLNKVQELLNLKSMKVYNLQLTYGRFHRQLINPSRIWNYHILKIIY
jgi:hypothetical protein